MCMIFQKWSVGRERVLDSPSNIPTQKLGFTIIYNCIVVKVHIILPGGVTEGEGRAGRKKRREGKRGEGKGEERRRDLATACHRNYYCIVVKGTCIHMYITRVDYWR